MTPVIRHLAALLALLWAGQSLAATLTGVSAVPAVVTITTDGPVAAASVLVLQSPDRLVVDVPAVIVIPMTAAGAASVRQLRLAAFAPGIARLVMDLDGPVLLVSTQAADRSLTLTLRRATAAEFAAAVKAGKRPIAVARAPHRLDLDMATTPTPSIQPPADQAQITPAGPGLPAAGTPIQPRPPMPEKPAQSPPATVETRPAPSRVIRSRSGGKPLVVIDAGHGGKDVGATSVRGGYEKDVTLAIALATAQALERRGKVRVRLTRADDRFIPLGGRVAIAQKARADLFVSVHADAALNLEARGASVYTLSSTASDAVAARLAARENKADIIGGINLGVEAPDVGDILIELSRRGTTDMSVIFAEALQEELSPRIRFRSTFHHFAGFRVLKAPDVPSVLLETGYVTNGEDADFLFSRDGQKRVAEGIARAIERHLVGG